MRPRRGIGKSQQDHRGPEIAAKARKDHRHAVRIIGGRWRGRRLPVAPDTAVRPTPDRVRETVFNWLGGVLQGAHCLDLFAGTGVLGLEALSRGASTALFVERDAELARALRARITELGADAAVLQRNVEALLRDPPPRAFDIVFLDPPYRLAVEPLLARLDGWLADRALIYVERPRAEGTSPGIDGLAAALRNAELIKSSRAGGVAFGLLEVRRP